MEAGQIVALKEAPVQPRLAPTRLGYVDGLRALAALEVVAFHAASTVWPTLVGAVGPWPSGLGALITAPALYGRAAVGAFIVISGFSLMLPVARNSGRLPQGAWRFYWRRARRILPPYYSAILLSLLLVWLVIGQPTGTMWDGSIPVTWRSVLTHALLIHNLTPGEVWTINPALWSIAVECQIYLLFPALVPALVLVMRRYHPLFVAACLCALCIALFVALEPYWVTRMETSMAAFAPQFLGLFVLGMALAWLVTRQEVQHKRSPANRRERIAQRAPALMVTPLVVIVAATGWRYAAIQTYLMVDLEVCALMCALMLAATRPGVIRAVLEWRPLVWIGGFSYSLYLIHAPLIQLLWQYVFHPLGLGDTATYLLLLLVGGPLIVLAAWGFWWLCERPFLNSRPCAARAR